MPREISSRSSSLSAANALRRGAGPIPPWSTTIRSTPVLLREAIRYRRSAAFSTAARKIILQKELRTIETQIARLLGAVADGTVPDRSMLGGQLTDLNARRGECVTLLKTLESDLPGTTAGTVQAAAQTAAAGRPARGTEALRPGCVRDRCGSANSRHFRTKVGRRRGCLGPRAPGRRVRSFVREWRTVRALFVRRPPGITLG